MRTRIRKIIIMTNEWFTNEKYKRNGVDEIIAAGYDVEIWNVNRVVFANVPDKPKDLYVGKVKVIDFKSKSELRIKLRQCGEEVLILNWYADYSDTESICRERVKYCNMYCAPVLCGEELDNLRHYYKKDIREQGVKKKRGKISLKGYARQMRGWFRDFRKRAVIKRWPPIYNFASTPAEYFPICRLFAKDKMIFIHAMDYDNYLRDACKEPKDDGYIVFIDEAWVCHPEHVLLNRVYNEKEIQDYYANMKAVFDALEQHYGKKVIIAAHPKAEYSGREFGDRKIVYFKTYELVKNCSFAIQHMSTMTNMIALFNKPFLSVINNEALKYAEDYGYDALREYFGCDIYNIDEKYDAPWNYIYYNKARYGDFLRDFVIGCSSEDRTFIEVVLGKIAEI